MRTELSPSEQVHWGSVQSQPLATGGDSSVLLSDTGVVTLRGARHIFSRHFTATTTLPRLERQEDREDTTDQ
eukprot:SAG31_NODE_581_length_13927_cov_78.549899_13_plen_72_part_00